jgi:hypothetical protein
MKGLRDIIKKLVLLAIIGAIIYTVLSYHFIFVGKKIRMLKKTGYNMDYIFYSVKGKRVETILSIDPLWEAGIGELLVEERLMSGENLELYKEQKEDQ